MPDGATFRYWCESTVSHRCFLLSSNTVCVGDVVNINDMSTDGPTSGHTPWCGLMYLRLKTLLLHIRLPVVIPLRWLPAIVRRRQPWIYLCACCERTAINLVFLHRLPAFAPAKQWAWTDRAPAPIAGVVVLPSRGIYANRFGYLYTTAQDINGCLNAIVQSVVVNPLPVLLFLVPPVFARASISQFVSRQLI